MLSESLIIFLLVVLLIWVDYNDNKINKMFSNIIDHKPEPVGIKEKYTNISPHITGNARPVHSAVNFGKKSSNFGNFGIVQGLVGGTNPLCNEGTLKYDCAPYPYDVFPGDNKMSVCTEYKKTTPEMTSARTVGRPRQCRKTYTQ